MHVPVPIRTVSPPNVSVHTAYCKVLAARQRGQSLGERDAVKIQVLFAHNIKPFGQQRQPWYGTRHNAPRQAQDTSVTATNPKRHPQVHQQCHITSAVFFTK